MSTLQTKITKINEIITVYDQIDYTLCKQNQKQTLIGARSWSNALVDSDFRIVATKLDVQLSKAYPKTIKLSKPFNTNMFRNDSVRNEYKQHLKDKINITQYSNDGFKQKW